MNTNKWWLEVVHEPDGTYYANMIVGGKRVTGLPEYVDYNTLRDAIKLVTGVEILKHKDMKFQQSNGKSYAYLDNTQPRSDCRVTLDEVRNGWKPDFDGLEPEKTVREQFFDKLEAEMQEFKDSYKSMTPTEIYNDWYIIGFFEEYFDMFEGVEFGEQDEVLSWLASQDKPLDFLYEKWMGSDGAFSHDWNDMISWVNDEYDRAMASEEIGKLVSEKPSLSSLIESAEGRMSGSSADSAVKTKESVPEH